MSVHLRRNPHLARKGAILSSVPNEKDALACWLHLLRRESAAFYPSYSKTYPQIGPQGIPKYEAGGRFQALLCELKTRSCSSHVSSLASLPCVLIPFSLQGERSPVIRISPGFRFPHRHLCGPQRCGWSLVPATHHSLVKMCHQL